MRRMTIGAAAALTAALGAPVVRAEEPRKVPSYATVLDVPAPEGDPAVDWVTVDPELVTRAALRVGMMWANTSAIS